MSDVPSSDVGKTTKHPGGRPTGYKPSFPKRLDEYLAKNKDEWTEFHKTRGLHSDTFERSIVVRLPSREGFADFLGVSHDALSDWGAKYPEFGVALARLDGEQKKRLINEGLAGNYNPVIAKLLLSSNHGMAERSEISQQLSLADLIKQQETTS